MEHREQGAIIIALMIILFSLLSGACKESLSPPSDLSSAGAMFEIDIHRITEATAINFKILKTSAIGQMPRNKFYWVSIETKVTQEKTEQLADAIIKDAIAKTRELYHSYTLHFFYEKDLKSSIEDSKALARANFLPMGGWAKVGRDPIDNYKNYQLTCKLVK